MFTNAQLAQFEQINADVNRIPYHTLEGPGEDADLWKDIPDHGGWYCRDYCLVKAERLREAGIPKEAITIALVWTEPVGNPPQREFHAVILVDSGDGDPVVLDSRFDNIYLKSQPMAQYIWQSRQVAGTTQFEPMA